MLLKIHEENPEGNKIQKIIECLNNDGVIIYPTDTVYSFGCRLDSTKGLNRVAKLKGIKPEKANFSLVCYDLSHLSDFAKHVSNPTFKLMKKNLPGPFTFIVEANGSVPKYFKSKKRTVGIRVPNNNIPRELVKQLGVPLISTSVYDEDEILEYTTDPELIFELYKKSVDIVINGGYGNNIASTVIDCTQEVPSILRQGAGELIE